MKRIKFFVLFFFLFSGIVLANGKDAEIDMYLLKMFEYAKAHDLHALIDLNSKIKTEDNRTLNIGYSLALYIASPIKYKDQYVESFPENYEGIGYDLYERIELKGLTPKFLYSVEALGLIAEEGNTKAIEKVLKGIIHSDGVVSELFCNFMERLFDKQPQKIIHALSELKKEQRDINYSCLKIMEPKKLYSLKNELSEIKPKASKSERDVIQEIEALEIKTRD